MANDNEKTAFNGGNPSFVNSKRDSFENKTSSGLTKSDLDSLANSFITQEIAEQAGLFRIDDLQGAEIVGRKPKAGSYYSGIVFPYFLPPNYNHPTQFRLRRDKSDYEQRAKGTFKEPGKYLSAPGARNMLYFPLILKLIG
jgi:hypothetical protein